MLSTSWHQGIELYDSLSIGEEAGDRKTWRGKSPSQQSHMMPQGNRQLGEVKSPSQQSNGNRKLWIKGDDKPQKWQGNMSLVHTLRSSASFAPLPTDCWCKMAGAKMPPQHSQTGRGKLCLQSSRLTSDRKAPVIKTSER
jgi:hypothetical protein